MTVEWDTSAVFGVVWLCVVVPWHLLGIALFWKRRTIQPITSRFPGLVVGCDLVLVAFELSLCTQRIIASTYPCLLNLWSGFIGLLILFNTYMWRSWTLYFIFGLTQERIQNVKKADSFFLKHRWLLNNDFLVQFFGTLTVVLALPCGLITATDRSLVSARGINCSRGLGDSFLAAYVALYLFFFFIMANKLRQVVDGFKIKEELRNTGIVAIVVFIPWIVFNNAKSAKYVNDEVFPFSTFFLLVGVSVTLGLSTIWPLYLSYFAPPMIEDAYSSDLSTLHGLLQDKVGLASFKQFLTKEFSVENILFYEEIEEYRAKKRHKSELELLGDAQKIYAKYVISDSPFQVNLPDLITKDLEKQLKDIFSAAGSENAVNNSKIETPSKTGATVQTQRTTVAANNPYMLNRDPPTIFDKAQENIFKLMNTDSFPRYARTEEYEALKKKKESGKRELEILADTVPGVARKDTGNKKQDEEGKFEANEIVSEPEPEDED